ncbi:hypothetical protein [Novosphingobium sp.]|uniref:hypothetical protein n=1 Tax=Novosphingobium sp. TaxID=1874826 RepID=UPI0038B97808|nr:hypothetical protein [Pseudomonadota bacterium]
MTHRTPQTAKPGKPSVHKPQGGRDDRLDADLERKRLEPGQNGDGEGDVGAPADTPSDGNSNT